MRFASIARFSAPDAGGGQPFQGTSSGKGTGMGAQTPAGAFDGTSSGRRTGETPPGATPADQIAIDFAAGTLLAGRYEVRSKLGAGGMGVVYRVHDRVQREDVALKAILPSLVQSEEALARFRNEAKIMLGLAHEGIVRVFDVNEDPATGLRFYTMELLQGMSLRAWLEEKKRDDAPVAPEEALGIVGQVLEALRFAHRKGVVHRDLKPENVFLIAGDGGAIRAKVLDFGIAKAQSHARFTGSNMALGTYDYMAPEQRGNAAEVDQRADIYSTCVILYEMLTGKLPLGRFKTPSEARKALPRAIDEVVMRGLEMEPAARPASAERLLAEVAEIRALLGGKRGGGGARWVAIAAAVLVLLGALGALAVFVAPRLSTVSLAATEPADGLLTRDDTVLVRGEARGFGLDAVLVNGRLVEMREGRFEARMQAAPVIEIVAKKADGTVLASVTRHLSIDHDPPSLRIDGPKERLTREASATIEGTEVDAHPAFIELAGGRRIQVAGDGHFRAEIALVEGKNEIALTPQDGAGNRGAREVVTIVRDSRPPAITLEPTPPSVAERRLTLAGTVDEDGCRVTVGTATASIAGRRFRAEVLLEKGANEIAIVATDPAGNEARATMRVRCEPALVTIEEPAEGLVTADDLISASGRADEVEVAHVRVNGTAVEPEHGHWEARVPAAPLVVEAIGKSGARLGEARRAIVADRDPPVIHLDPVAQLTADDSVTIAGSIDDAHPPREITIGKSAVPLVAGRFTCTRSLVEGTNAFELAARDTLGNEAKWNMSVTRDCTPPTLKVYTKVPPDGAIATWSKVFVVRGKFESKIPAAILVNGVKSLDPASFEFEVPLATTAAEHRFSIVGVDRLGRKTAPFEIAIRRRDGERPRLYTRSDLPDGCFAISQPAGTAVRADANGGSWSGVSFRGSAHHFAVTWQQYSVMHQLTSGVIEIHPSADDYIGGWLHSAAYYWKTAEIEAPHEVWVNGMRGTRLAMRTGNFDGPGEASFPGQAEAVFWSECASGFLDAHPRGDHVYVVLPRHTGFYALVGTAPQGGIPAFEREFDDFVNSFEELPPKP